MTVTPALPRARRLAAVLLLAPLLAACSGAAPTASPSPAPTASPIPSFSVPPYTAGSAPSNCPTSTPADASAGYKATVTMGTPFGSIAIKVDGSSAPHAVGAFVALAKCGYYNNVIFHRIVPGFVIQGGDGQYGRMPLTTENLTRVGTGTPGWNITDDKVATPYKRGTVAMARGSAANSEGSQFFIVLDDKANDALSSANNYAIVGTVSSGMDAVDKIATVPCTASQGPDAQGNAPEVSFPLYALPVTNVTVTEP